MRHACDLLHQNSVRILFFVLYSAVFFMLSKFLLLFLPIVLGILLYFLIYPLYRQIHRRTRLPEKICAYTVSGICFILITLIFSVLVILLCREAAHLLSGDSYFHFNAFLPQVRSFIENISSRIPKLTERITGDLPGMLSALLPYAGNTFRLFLCVPAILVLPALAFAFTCSFLLHRRRLRHLLSVLLGSKNHLRLRHTFKAQSANSSGFIFSYVLIYLTTFAEACIVLSLLKMPYPLITALIVTVSDIFPVLGPGTVLLPLCIYRLLCGAYTQAIGLLAGWLLITVIRQIIEPRLISKISRTPGIVMLTAVYASLIFSNFWIIPYTALLFYLYNLFSDAGLFSRISRTALTEKVR